MARSYKIQDRGGPKSLKMAFECSFQSFSYKSFANIQLKGLNKSATVHWFGEFVKTSVMTNNSLPQNYTNLNDQPTTIIHLGSDLLLFYMAA